MENLPPTVGSPAELRTFSTRPLALAIGVFDGVHRGHRKLLAEVVRLAAENGALPVALTFDPHPRAVLHPAAPPVLLVGLTERVRLLREAGMASCVVCPFTPEFARTEPDDFLDNLLDGAQIAAIGVGRAWRFGAGGRGDAALLQRCAERRHWRLSAVPELELDGETVSASRIRRVIAGGDLAEADRLLGWHYAYWGRVCGGHHVAGLRLDCPTANIEPEAGVLPPDGVYAGIVRSGGKSYMAAVNIGIAPTYARPADRVRRVEAHLLGFSGDLYGCRVKLELEQYLRSERCFASETDLKRQIRDDIAAIRRIAEEKKISL